MKKKSSKSIALVISLLVIVILVLVGTVLWLNVDRTPVYHGVYLNTGDMYFGELSRFPTTKLSNAWHLVAGAEGVSINRFSDSAWEPEGTIKFNSDAIVWVARVSDDSPLIQGFQQEPQARSPQSQNPEPIETDTE